MNYYKSNVKLISTKLEYNVPDIQKIKGIKYMWSPENKGIDKSHQAVCCFLYDDELKETSDIKKITKEDFDSFCNVILTSKKTSILSDGKDSTDITAVFPEGGGTVKFVIIKPDNTDKTIDVPISDKGIAVLSSHVTSEIPGKIKIRIKSDKWHNVSGLGAITIESS